MTSVGSRAEITTLSKRCIDCTQIKSSDQFNVSKKAADGLQSRCRDCSKAKWSKWYYANRRASVDRSVRHFRKSKYGITQHAYDALRSAQGDRCAICRKDFHELPKAPAVDHCHNTGRVRGLLCSNCNTGLGLFKDNEEMLAKAVAYLRRSRGAE